MGGNILLEIGPGRFAHPGGVLWLADAKTAVVADAHLGYGWAQRRRGELGPVEDTKSQPRLLAMAADLGPERIVFLGDLVHAPRPGVDERGAIEGTLGELAALAEIVLVRGNHDRAFVRDFGHLGVRVVEQWRGAGVAALHGDRLSRMAVPEGTHLVLGHLHPIRSLRDAAGAKVKLRIFLVSEGVTVLPAFSPYSAGFDVLKGLPKELRDLIGRNPVEGVAVTGKRVVRLGQVG